MTKYESYAARHSKQSPRAFTPNPHSTISPKLKPIPSDLFDQLNGKASKTQVSLLNQRLFQIQHKMTNLTNIVKLVQKYTETQDIQYQKEKRMVQGKESMLSGLIADHEMMIKRQEEYMIEIQQTQRKIKQNTFQQSVKEMGDKLRKQMNLKIQILINQIKSNTNHTTSNTSFERMQMDEMRERLVKLESGVIKTVSKKEFVKFKEDVNEEMENIVERFTKMIKKYMRSGTPTKESQQLETIDKKTIDASLERKGRGEKQKEELSKERETKAGRIGGETEKIRRYPRDNSEQNIHPNIQAPLTPKSKTKSKQKSLSKGKHIMTLQRNISPKLKISDKRKQKQAQLKQIIKHSKDNKKSLR